MSIAPEYREAINAYRVRNGSVFPCGHRVTAATSKVTLASGRTPESAMYWRVRCLEHYRLGAKNAMRKRRLAEKRASKAKKENR